jgi:hypothetical protein
MQKKKDGSLFKKKMIPTTREGTIISTFLSGGEELKPKPKGIWLETKRTIRQAI